jgi:selenocysteine lyase/cysteine desulfurase
VPTSTRRALIGAGLAGLAAGSLAGCDSDASRDTAAAGSSSSASPGDASTSESMAGSVSPSGPAIPDFDPTDWDSVRAQFPLDTTMSQFAAFVLSPHTAQVDAAIDYHRHRLAVDTEQTLLDGLPLEDAVRQAAADYAGGAPGDFALTDSTTMGIAHMYGGLTLSEGDEVLSTTHDFYSTEESLRLLALRTGATVKRVSLYDQPWRASVDEMVSRLVAGVGPRTRVVGVTWVHSSTGVRLPIQEMSAALEDATKDADQPVVFCVDGVHGFGAVDVDVPELGCDFLAVGTHKWLFGPRGTGILWGRSWGPLTELIPTFSGFENGARLSPGGYHDFEHRWALSEAFAFHQRIGRAAVVERTVGQATRLKEGLAAADNLRVITPADPEVSAGIVCIEVPGVMPGNSVVALRQQGIVASATPYKTSYLRLGPSIVTTPEQVDAAVEAVTGLV